MNAQSKINEPATPRPLSKLSKNNRLAIWLSKLPKHVMPIDGGLAKLIVNEINDDASTADKLAALIKQEPILCLKLYLKASRQLKERENIQGLVHLIGLLGTEQIKHVIGDAPKQKTAPAGQQELYSASRTLMADVECRTQNNATWATTG